MLDLYSHWINVLREKDEFIMFEEGDDAIKIYKDKILYFRYIDGQFRLIEKAIINNLEYIISQIADEYMIMLDNKNLKKDTIHRSMIIYIYSHFIKGR